MASPLSRTEPWDAVAARYNDTSRIFLGLFAHRALEQLDLQPHHCALDVACGPGTLSLPLAHRVQRVTAIDFSPRMLAHLRANAAAAGVVGLEVVCGDGQRLPFDDGQFDIAVSLFGLMFFPDRARGLAELYRTLKPGAQVLISSWAPVSQSSAMQLLFGALVAADPSRTVPQPDPTSLENPEVLAAELSAAGFEQVRVVACRQELEVTDVEQIWRGLVDGNAMLHMQRGQLAPALWAAREQISLQWLATQLGPLPARLDSTAWLGTARKPR